MFKPFPRSQYATKAQSFPRKSSNTASPMIARHAEDFKGNRGCSSNSPPLKHGDQIPHLLEDSDNQIPFSPGRQRCQMPGVCPGGGGGMLKFRFDRYISRFCLCEGFPVIAKRTAKDARGNIVGPPKNGAVGMLLQLPCTSALLSDTFYCKSTHDP